MAGQKGTTMSLIPTRERGKFIDSATGNVIHLTEAYYGSRYDTVVTASGAVTADTVKKFFDSTSNKSGVDGNFPQANRVLSAGEEMVLEHIGVYIPTCMGNTVVPPADIKKGAENAFIEVKIDKDLIAEGPAIDFPSGRGLAGQTVENGAGVVSLGVPSTAAVRPLPETQKLDDKTDVQGTRLVWHDHVWDATNMPTLAGKVWHRLGLFGLITNPATRRAR